MTKTASIVGISQPRRDALLRWYWAWLLGLLGLAGLLLLSHLSGASVAAIAVASMALPAVIGRGYALERGRTSRTVLLVHFTIAAGIAGILTGGLTGPVGIWTLIPMTVGVLLCAPGSLATGAALSASSALLLGFLQLKGLVVSVPPSPLALILGLIAQITTALGLASSILLAQGLERDRLANQLGEGRWAGAMLQGFPGLLLGLRPDGRVCAVYGTPPEGMELMRLCLDGLLSQVDPDQRTKVREALAIATETGRGQVEFAPYFRPDRWMRADMSRTAPDLIVARIGDVTGEVAQIAKLEQARREAESRADSRSQFLAHMSHELRTPLNAIMGFSDIMRTGLFGALEGRYLEYSQLIHESGAHLLDLISDVMDLSKIEADRYELTREVFDVRDAVAGALRLVRQQADDASLKLRGVMPPGPLFVDADRRAVKQIVLNLVSNALKFTPQGGLVTVVLQARRETMIEIVVSDTGPGIAPEDLERLGRPFEQAGSTAQKLRGTGLGLSLVRAFATLHGGEMILESRLGEGTAVTVRLPVRVEPDTPSLDAWGENVVAFDLRR